jgi:sortase A
VGLGLLLLAVVQIQLDQVKQVAPVVQNSKPAGLGTLANPTPPTGQPTPEPSPTSIAPSMPTNFGAASYATRPKMGERIGTITLTNLKLSWPIYEGTNGSELHKGVGHYRSSVLPGENDNSVLSGHRATVFNRLGQLRIGQSILVRTRAGTFNYIITGTRIVKRTDKSVIVHTPHAVLTLTTCYPFNAVGTTTQAYIVSATLTN